MKCEKIARYCPIGYSFKIDIYYKHWVEVHFSPDKLIEILCCIWIRNTKKLGCFDLNLFGKINTKFIENPGSESSILYSIHYA